MVPLHPRGRKSIKHKCPSKCSTSTRTISGKAEKKSGLENNVSSAAVGLNQRAELLPGARVELQLD